MKPPPFDYVAPASLEEALDIVAEYGDDAQPLAGGQSLIPMLALRVARPGILVDLSRIEDLKGITVNGAVRLGAMTRQVEVLKSAGIAQALPGLAAATWLVGHYQTRNRGTIGGSISLGEPAAENPAFALALNADLELRSKSGTRTITTDAFYTGPYMTERQPDELLTSITYRPAPGARIAVDEVGVHRGDFALSGLVAYIDAQDGRITAARLAWFGMGPQPLRAPTAEAALTGVSIRDIDLDALADLALEDTDPSDDGHATAVYRRAAGRALFKRVMPKVFPELSGAGGAK